MSIAALFTIAKIWKQPKCPSVDKWIKKMWYIHTMDFYSAIKKNEILAFATAWMDLGGIMLSEIEKNKQCDFTYMWNLMNKINEQNSNRVIDTEN